MRVAVMGSGGVGGFYGALLARSGHEVTFIARGSHLQAIRERGLRVEGVDGAFTVHAPATDDTISVGPVDLVLLTVKAYDNSAALEQTRPLVGPQTVALSLQNGVQSGAEIARALGRQHVLEGCVYIGAAIKEPGVIAQTGGSLQVFFGEPDGGLSERCRRLERTLKEAGWRVQLSDNIRRELWRKLTFVGPLAAICSLTRLPLGSIRDCRDTVDLLRHALDEVVAVGNAQGAGLPTDVAKEVVQHLDQLPAATVPSMLRDVRNGKPIELETLVGSVVQRGRDAGIPTPIHHTLYALLLPLARGQAPPRPQGPAPSPLL